MSRSTILNYARSLQGAVACSAIVDGGSPVSITNAFSFFGLARGGDTSSRVLASIGYSAGVTGLRISVTPGILSSTQVVVNVVGSTAATVTFTLPRLWPLGTWATVGVVYNGTDVLLYVNGNQYIGTVSGTIPTSILGTGVGSNISIYAADSSSSWISTGNDFQFYNVALTPGQMHDLNDTAVTTVTPYLRFPMMSGGTSLYDTVRGATATLTGTSWSSVTYQRNRYSVGNYRGLHSVGFSGSSSYAQTDAPINGTVLDPGLNDFSVSCWYKVRESGTTRYIVGNKTSNATNQIGYSFVAVTGANNAMTPSFSTSDGSTGLNQTGTTPDGVFLRNKWVHVLGVVDRTNNVQRFYVNGILQNTATPPSGTFSNTTNRLTVAGPGAAGAPGTFSNILVENVRYFNAALTDDEAYQLYSRGNVVANKIAAEYMMNEGAGTTLSDRRGVGPVITLTSATWDSETPF